MRDFLSNHHASHVTSEHPEGLVGRIRTASALCEVSEME